MSARKKIKEGRKLMEKMYEFMDQYLGLEKQVASFLYVIARLEQSYSEETQKEEKYLANTVEWMLLQIQREMKKIIGEMDVYIVEEKHSGRTLEGVAGVTEHIVE